MKDVRYLFINFIPIRKLRKKLRRRLKEKTSKYYGLNLASNGEEMLWFTDWVNKYSGIKVKNVFEIGANYGQDAEFIANYFGVDSNDVYIFEPHPVLYKKLLELHPKYKVYDLGVCDQNGESKFSICSENDKNTGIFSMKGVVSTNERHITEIEIKTTRMDTFMEKNKIKEIDFCKIDVEGMDYEVLIGFGNKIRDIKCLHIESQITENWPNQKLFSDISKLLLENKFEMIYFDRYGRCDSNSFWVNKKYIL